ncbi:MAG: SWIB/MDM2 domain-containing protein [Burkholderiaceae bacterium]|nr:SWIB/MDM2 domain-containing protein [Burkholderiaceae bacterium]
MATAKKAARKPAAKKAVKKAASSKPVAKKAAVKKAAAKAPAKKAAAKSPAKKAAARAPAKKAAAKAPARKAAASKPAATKATARKPNAAFMKALTPSVALASIVGDKPLPRTEVVKRMWDYIKKGNLQDEVNKRLINADDKLRQVFGKAQVNMFEMTGLLGKHLK